MFFLFSTTHCSLLKLIVRFGLDVPTFATRRVTTREHPAAEGGTVGEKCPGMLPKCRLPRYILGSFTCRKATTWDQRLYFPSEGRIECWVLFRPKNRPGVNSRTWVPKASTLPLEHRSPSDVMLCLLANIYRRFEGMVTTYHSRGRNIQEDIYSQVSKSGTSCSKCKASDLYSGTARFKSRQ